MDDPNNPLNSTTWIRGTWLGVGLLFLFVLGAALIFLLAGLLGMDSTAAALIAMCAGPFIGGAIFYIYFSVAQPQLSPLVPPRYEAPEIPNAPGASVRDPRNFDAGTPADIDLTDPNP